MLQFPSEIARRAIGIGSGPFGWNREASTNILFCSSSVHIGSLVISMLRPSPRNSLWWPSNDADPPFIGKGPNPLHLLRPW